VQVLQRLRDKRQGRWFLYHDNALSHTSLGVQQFITEKKNSVFTQRPHSRDFAPSYFWLFPTVKKGLKVTRYGTFENITSNATLTRGDSKRDIPPVLPTMAESMQQLFVHARVLLWRLSGKRSRISYQYSAIPPFRELFDYPIYISQHNTRRHALRCAISLDRQHIISSLVMKLRALSMTWHLAGYWAGKTYCGTAHSLACHATNFPTVYLYEQPNVITNYVYEIKKN
jgi:hypothetical protein